MPRYRNRRTGQVVEDSGDLGLAQLTSAWEPVAEAPQPAPPKPPRKVQVRKHDD